MRLLFLNESIACDLRSIHIECACGASAGAETTAYGDGVLSLGARLRQEHRQLKKLLLSLCDGVFAFQKHDRCIKTARVV